ncbi:MAG: hypothetical protein WCG27_02175 [Pseudomonadota bacterium]
MSEKNKRRIYLINPPFQLRLAIYLFIIMIVTSIVYPFTIYELINGIALQLGAQNAVLVDKLIQKKYALIFILSLWQLGIGGVFFIICIFLTHRIAGPIYKLEMFLNQIQGPDKINKLSFRKGDYFLELPEIVNNALSRIQDKYRQDFTYLEQVKTYLGGLSPVVPDDKKIILQEINRKLTEMLNRFNAS